MAVPFVSFLGSNELRPETIIFIYIGGIVHKYLTLKLAARYMLDPFLNNSKYYYFVNNQVLHNEFL